MAVGLIARHREPRTPQDHFPDPSSDILQDEQGALSFPDQDPESFKHLLAYLRTGQLPFLEQDILRKVRLRSYRCRSTIGLGLGLGLRLPLTPNP